MNSEDMRRAMIKNPTLLRSALLSPSQLNLYRIVKKRRGVTSAELSRLRRVSVANASMQLSKLRDAGYLERQNMGAASGGLEYVYIARAF